MSRREFAKKLPSRKCNLPRNCLQEKLICQEPVLCRSKLAKSKAIEKQTCRGANLLRIKLAKKPTC